MRILTVARDKAEKPPGRGGIFEYGRAAALAAALSIASGRRLRDLPGQEIREQMRALGSSL
ncbi:hypothetical protein ACLQ9J_01315 [Bordetella hinzii]|uniref:hypothetical protein n=1 Tax=Bordetella hinzii TaxID=103855 RepID=UPI0039FB969C